MFSKRSNRGPRRILVLEFNPYQILAAEISRPARGDVTLEAAAEFNHDDAYALRGWIDARDEGRKSRAIAICGLIPLRGIVLRASVEPARVAETDYLEGIVQELQKGRFLTSTPFKILKEHSWTFHAVNAFNGRPVAGRGPAEPALICSQAIEDVVEVQQRLVDNHLIRERVEPGVLSLFGAVYDLIAQRGDTRAVVIVVIYENVTAIYILSKDGVHTPNPVSHGLHSVVESARKELGLKSDAEALAELRQGNPVLIERATKLVRRISHDLKPVIDSFEMTTGQPVDEIYCAYLPPNLSWIGEPLVRSVGRMPFSLDCNQWLQTAHVQVAAGTPAFGPQWLGALSLVASLPESAGTKFDKRARGQRAHHRPWHIDCSTAAEFEDPQFTGRGFLAGAFVATLALFAIMLTVWQVYASNSLRTDTQYWEKQMTENRKLFEELSAANLALKKQSAVLDRAYELMTEPYPHSDLFVNLGRTIPPRMRVDRIDANDARVAISGAVLEPAEEASATLGQYVDDLRHNPAIAPLFSSIAITTFQRKTGGIESLFELTLRSNRPTP